MSVLDWRLLIDFGLVILIWMTQLIVYPSFIRFSEADLHKWHSSYNRRITVIVLPLMLSQLTLSIWQIVQEQNAYHWVSVILIVVVWGITFSQAVPLHAKIQQGEDLKVSAQRLVRVNWSRTVIWTLIFVFTLAQYFL